MLNYSHQTVDNQQHHDSHHLSRSSHSDYANGSYSSVGSQFNRPLTMVPSSTTNTSATSDLVQQFGGTQFFSGKNNNLSECSSSVVGHENIVGAYPASDHTQLQYKSSENTKRFSVNNLLQLPGCCNDDSATIRRDQNRGEKLVFEIPMRQI